MSPPCLLHSHKKKKFSHLTFQLWFVNSQCQSLFYWEGPLLWKSLCSCSVDMNINMNISQSCREGSVNVCRPTCWSRSCRRSGNCFTWRESSVITLNLSCAAEGDILVHFSKKNTYLIEVEGIWGGLVLVHPAKGNIARGVWLLLL